MYTAGANERGQCGLPANCCLMGSEGAALVVHVTRVPALDLHKVVSVACGLEHTLALTEQVSKLL